MKAKTNRLLAILLTLLTVIGMFPSAAFALEQGEPSSLTEKYINEADGREIDKAQTTKTTEVKNPEAVVGYEYVSFSEVTEHIYAKEDLTYIFGYPDKTVRGESYLARSEAAAIFYRLYDGFYPKLQRQMKSSTFSDVSKNSWYYTELELCYNVGIISGFSDGTFKPNDPVSRAEFAAMAARFAELTNSDKAMFTDVTKDHWAYQAINAAAEAGWVRGYPDGAYHPESDISRSETVTLINRLRNRSITVEELKELGIKNPYTDLVETYWAYTDLMEATVKHAAADWHDLSYNDGKLNIIVEKYVDGEGKEIAEPIVSEGKENHAYRSFDKHNYLGYITEITYVYSKGVAKMNATKSVDKSTAKVGDTLTYTITASNSDEATANLKNAVMRDTLSGYLTFTHGSVQVDGYSARYSYDNESKLLSVPLGEIAAGQTKTITFSATVNSTAYGKSFENTAILSADNDDDKTVTDDGVTIEDGTAEGSVGAKTVSSATAKVGDTLTYTITLRNASTATAAWTGIEVSDVIPEYLSFVSGSIEEDGRSSTNFSYDADTTTLTLFADIIEIGETKTFTFKVTVQDGAQGLYIVNTAIVGSDDREDIQLPDTGVQIDEGDTSPYMSKSASVSEANVGDIFTYTVNVKNGADATTVWKDIILTDVLPTGTKLVSGSVTLNGQTVSYGVAGQAIEVTVGNLKAGQDAIITFDVRVLESAAGTTIENVAVAKGSNGDKTATDNGVTVPENTPPENDNNIVTGTKMVDKTIVSVGEKVTYTITATNNSKETWTGVQVYDVLDTSVLTFINDSVYIDGIRFVNGAGKWNFADRQLVVTFGDIEAGKSAKCDFTVQFKNDAANSTYTNHATLKSTSHDSVYVKAPEVIITSGDDDISLFSEIHYKLFAGYGDGDGNNLHLWKPEDNIRMDQICMVGYRMMTDYYRHSLGSGTNTIPEGVKNRDARFMISHGVISGTEYSAGADATQSQIYRILNFAIGAGMSSNSSASMTRASVAALICDLAERDTTPSTDGLAVSYFSDKGSYSSLIDEVSNSHDYTLDSKGNETWISILND